MNLKEWLMSDAESNITLDVLEAFMFVFGLSFNQHRELLVHITPGMSEIVVENAIIEVFLFIQQR